MNSPNKSENSARVPILPQKKSAMRPFFHLSVVQYLSIVILLFFCTSFCPVEQTFKAEQVPQTVRARMMGKSYKNGCRVAWNDLRYVTVLHYDLKGNVKTGELVCNKSIANDLVEIFRELYKVKYPIERMQLIDNYNADDEASMRANNTSCFNYRVIAGSNTLSYHSQGRAIDINPLYNPCVKVRTGAVQPSTATAYKNRTKSFPCKITTSDTAYKLFIKHGFRWGGNWRYTKDYQHFEK